MPKKIFFIFHSFRCDTFFSILLFALAMLSATNIKYFVNFYMYNTLINPTYVYKCVFNPINIRDLL